MIQGLAGAEVLQAGDEISLPAETAERYVLKGLAEYVNESEGKLPSGPPVKRARKANSKKVTEKR
jgi:hypothetical protein